MRRQLASFTSRNCPKARLNLAYRRPQHFCDSMVAIPTPVILALTLRDGRTGVGGLRQFNGTFLWACQGKPSPTKKPRKTYTIVVIIRVGAEDVYSYACIMHATTKASAASEDKRTQKKQKGGWVYETGGQTVHISRFSRVQQL